MVPKPSNDIFLHHLQQLESDWSVPGLHGVLQCPGPADLEKMSFRLLGGQGERQNIIPLRRVTSS